MKNYKIFYIFLLLNFFNFLFATEIGIDYHAYGKNFKNTVFLPKYHNKKVRDEVKKQLKEMKNSGIDYVFTHLYIGAPEHSRADALKKNRRINPYLIAFPPTSQDLLNIQTYIQDVKEAGLALDLGFLWLGQADFEVGCINPSDDGNGKSNPKNCTQAALGHGHLKPDNFFNKAYQTITDIFNLPNINYVRKFYFDGEIQYDPNPDKLPIGNLRRVRRNQDWFFRNLYDDFSRDCTKNGIRPTFYFLITKPKKNIPNGILNYTWHEQMDKRFKVISAHRTMYGPYRALKFINKVFKEEKWPDKWYPERFELSLYIDINDTKLYRDWVGEIIGDINYLLKVEHNSFKDIGIAETSYFKNCDKRIEAYNILKESGVKSITYWTTPYSKKRKNVGNVEVGYITHYKDCSLEKKENIIKRK